MDFSSLDAIEGNGIEPAHDEERGADSDEDQVFHGGSFGDAEARDGG
jgi:hypothetical protein